MCVMQCPISFHADKFCYPLSYCALQRSSASIAEFCLDGGDRECSEAAHVMPILSAQTAAKSSTVCGQHKAQALAIRNAPVHRPCVE